jgi:glutamate-1-semialdehyde 2,1-aminomutase
VQEQVARVTHVGGSHELEIRWAELVNALVPCAELTRFTMSGTEATHLALRVARAHTGRSRVVKLSGHFHGWHDAVTAGVNPPYDTPISAGVPAGTLEHTILCPPNDIKAVEMALEAGDIAAVILEPAGGQAGTTPTIPGYLHELRARTRERGAVLIFDEVITGFRYAPGGTQQYFDVTPDLTTLAKIVAGGLPGGALAGRADIMSVLAHRGNGDWDRTRRVAHAGTFNANPVSAAAGITTLELVSDASLQARANKLGESSIYHVSFDGRPGLAGPDRPKKGALYHLLRCALLNNGVDCSPNHGWISAVHTEEDIERSIAGYERAFRAMAAEGAFRGH